MTKEEAKAEINKVFEPAFANYIITALTEGATPSDCKSKWIPVSERLPEEGERVLATHLGGIDTNRQVIEHIYENGKFTCNWYMDMDITSPTFGQRYMGDVIAWMPEPKPYKEGAEYSNDDSIAILKAMQESADAVRNSPQYDFSCVKELLDEEGAEE